MLVAGGRAVASLLSACAWQRGLGGALGSIRTKRWKPFHSMYRSNFLRELRRKQLEAKAEEVIDTNAPHVDAAAESRRAVERSIATTPFQATRLMRVFDVFPQRNATVRFWVLLNVDLTRESVRGTCHLPNGLKSDTVVLAFCPDEDRQEMLAAGADYAGISGPIRRIQQGWFDFDRCIATPGIMPRVMPIARLLGPRRMMPNPRSGTVVADLKKAIIEAKAGTQVEYRAEGEGEVKLEIADADFSDAQVLENMKYVVQTLLRARPRTSKSATASSEVPMTPLTGSIASKSTESDSYFLEATLQLGSKGPLIRVDAESMMPTSVGYFR